MGFLTLLLFSRFRYRRRSRMRMRMMAPKDTPTLTPTLVPAPRTGSAWFEELVDTEAVGDGFLAVVDAEVRVVNVVDDVSGAKVGSELAGTKTEPVKIDKANSELEVAGVKSVPVRKIKVVGIIDEVVMGMKSVGWSEGSNVDENAVPAVVLELSEGMIVEAGATVEIIRRTLELVGEKADPIGNGSCTVTPPVAIIVRRIIPEEKSVLKYGHSEMTKVDCVI